MLSGKQIKGGKRKDRKVGYKIKRDSESQPTEGKEPMSLIQKELKINREILL